MGATKLNFFKQSIGWELPIPENVSGLSSNTYLTTTSFIPLASKTLNAVRLYLTIVGSGWASTDISLNVYSNSISSGNTAPATLLGSVSLGHVPTTGWTDFTGLSIAVSAGNMYWVVVESANAAPATNYYTVESVQPFSGSGYLYKYSTNGGTTWNANSGGVIRLGYSDGSYEGIVLHGGTYNTFAGSNGEIGTQFTLPSDNVTRNVIGVYGLIGRATSGTGDLAMKLYTGSPPTLVDSVTIPTASIEASSSWEPKYGQFSTTHAIAPGSIVTVTFSNTLTTGTQSFFYAFSPWDTDVNSALLAPMAEFSPRQAAKSTGGVWSYTSGQLIYCALSLDPTGEFTASGGGSGGVPTWMRYDGSARA